MGSEAMFGERGEFGRSCLAVKGGAGAAGDPARKDFTIRCLAKVLDEGR